MSGFPRRIEVLDAQGKVAHTVAKLPLVEGLPTGNDAVPAGVRSASWRADAPATLVWAEAQDGGDPARAATPDPRHAAAYAAAYRRFLHHLDAARSAHAAASPSQDETPA